VLGSGFLAGAVTGRLLDRVPVGTNVTVYGRNQHLLGWQLELGAARAASPADLAARSECVLVITDSAEEVERQLNGPNGLQAGVHSPTTAIIGTVVPPARLSALSDRVIDQTAGQLRLVDAPLGGPRSAAVRGELSISVGTTPSRFAQVEPVLALLGRSVRVGGLGTAQVAHACQQLVSAATAIGISEATMIAERAGLDAAALGISGGQSLPRDLTPDLTAGVLLAPLLVAADAADRGGIQANLVDQLRHLADQVAAAGLDGQDLSTAYRILAAKQFSGELQNHNH
jgi:2-hydroxy-3-oxopropionate reductase